MLLWTTFLCLFSANLVTSQFAKPEILADYDPSTVLQPLNSNLQNMDSSDNLHVIRGLLKSRQSGCPTGYGECTNPAGRCCPTSGSCCQTDGCCQAGYFCYSTGCCPTGSNGCGGNSCCEPGETCCDGGGCCESGYNCATVNGVRGCCPVGKTCTSTGDTPQCETPSYVVCTGETFCCPPGYTCFRDSAGNPQCSAGGGGNSIPSTLTNTNFANSGSPSGTFIGTTSSTSTTPKGPSTAVLPPTTSSTSGPTPSSSNNNNNGGLTSSAISVAVDAIIASLAGVGVFAYLF